MTLPTDLVFVPVDKRRLETPLIPDSVGFHDKSVLPTGRKVADEERKRLDFVVSEVARLWHQAKEPIILIDACAIRYGVGHLVQDLIKATGVKFYTTPMGRSAIDEDPANGFGGVYVGAVTDPKVKAIVEKTDLAFMVRWGLLSVVFGLLAHLRVLLPCPGRIAQVRLQHGRVLVRV